MVANIKSKKSIYLDSSATTPPHSEVIKIMGDVQKNFWGNPSSLHSHGIKSAEILKDVGFTKEEIVIDEKEIIDIIETYTYEAGVRKLKEKEILMNV